MAQTQAALAAAQARSDALEDLALEALAMLTEQQRAELRRRVERLDAQQGESS